MSADELFVNALLLIRRLSFGSIVGRLKCEMTGRCAMGWSMRDDWKMNGLR
jgi:hypothetical protein